MNLVIRSEMIRGLALQSVMRSQRLVSESRRWLDSFYHVKPCTVSKASFLICLLCGQKADFAHTLEVDIRSSREFAAEEPGVDLEAQLGGFGFCHPCVLKYQGQHLRLAFRLDRTLQ